MARMACGQSACCAPHARNEQASSRDADAGVSEPMGDSLPDSLRRYFWETDRESVSWEHDRDYIVARLLAVGDLDAIRWLRRQLGDEPLRGFLVRRRCRGLSPQQMRFWEIVLDLPHGEVTAWIEEARRSPWTDRARR